MKGLSGSDWVFLVTLMLVQTKLLQDNNSLTWLETSYGIIVYGVGYFLAMIFTFLKSFGKHKRRQELKKDIIKSDKSAFMERLDKQQQERKQQKQSNSTKGEKGNFTDN